MNFTFLSQHKILWLWLIITITTICLTAFYLGDIKETPAINFIDIAGEGGITIMTLIWIFFTLVSRPAGRVTNLLFIGLLFTHVSVLLDFLDEFLVYPLEHNWFSSIEALPAPLGMVLMSIALYQWHQEQTTINRQLSRTERFYREHSLIDFTTGLYSADYMKQQIKLEITHAHNQNSSFSLMMLDLRRFTQFNLDFGYQHGDQLLRKVALLIQANIREGDIACRYASDRFIVLMPNTSQKAAHELEQHTKQAIEYLAFKHEHGKDTIYPKVITCSHQYQGSHRYEEVLQDINEHLTNAKQSVNQACSQ